MEIMEIYNKLIDKQLDLDKIMSLPIEDKKIIMNLYDQMHNSINGEIGTFGGVTLPGDIKIDTYRFNIIYNTLTEHGYLITRREKRLNDVLEK